MKKLFTLLFTLTLSTAVVYAQQTQAVVLPVCGALPSPTITGHSVAFTSGTTADVTITWTGSGATAYSLWYKTNNTWAQVCGGASTFSCTVHNLNLEWEYSFQVRAGRFCKLINGEPDDETTTADLRFRLPPPAPTGLTVSYKNSTSFVALWTYVQSVATYFIDVSTSPTFNTLVLNNVKVREPNSILVNNLTPGTYYYRVRALSASGLSPNSATYTVNLTLDAPSWVNVTEDPLHVFYIMSWQPSLGAASYTIQISPSPDFSNQVSIFNTPDTATHKYTPLNYFTPNTIYYIRVKAVNGVSQSVYSAPASFTQGPWAPTFSEALQDSHTSFRVRWNKGVGVTRYLLEVSQNVYIDPADASYQIFDAGLDTTYEVTNQPPGTYYYYRIIAENEPLGLRNYAPQGFANMQPSMPENITFTATPNSIDVTWTADNSPFYDYVLDRATDVGFENTLYRDLFIGSKFIHFEQGILPGTTYYFRVRTFAPNGDSPYAPTVEIHTPAANGVAAFQEEATDNLFTVYPNPGNSQFNVAFHAPESASGHQVEIRVLNASGETVSRIAREAGSFTESLDLSAQPLGVYTVQLAYQGRVIHKKIVKR